MPTRRPARIPTGFQRKGRLTKGESVTFLRPCTLGTVIADARLLKLGRLLATIDVRLWQGSEDRIVAQATVGYALP